MCEIVKSVCVYCGNEFEFQLKKQKKRSICDECRKAKRLEYDRQRRAIKQIERKRVKPAIPMEKIIEEIKDYNKINGTYISYGKYVGLTKKW